MLELYRVQFNTAQLYIHETPKDFEIHRQVISLTNSTCLLFPFRTGYGDLLTTLDILGSRSATDDGGNPHFPGDNRSMASPSPLVGDDRTRFLHDRFPIRVRLVGN